MVASALRRSKAIWLGAILLAGCAESEGGRSTPELQTWVIGDAAAAGFDSEALDQLGEHIRTGEFPNTHAVLVAHNGVLIYERYFSGPDERWGDPIPERAMGRDSLHDLRSISKSVTSVLLGLALAEDFEAALSRPVSDYLPYLDVGEEQRRITLHHMLTMTPGLEWNEMTVPYTDSINDEIRLYGAVDPAAEVLSRPIVQQPGATWYYNGGSTQVLATIIFQLTGQTIDDFARERLFAPLGITDYEWLGPGSWMPDNPAAMSGLRLTARDLTKIGSVYVHGGRWRGQQIVPAEWISRSSERHVPEIGDWSDGGTWGYGYQWWVGDLPSGYRVVAGFGNGNQRLFVIPSEQLVVTVLAGQYNDYGPYSERILDRVLEARRQ